MPLRKQKCAGFVLAACALLATGCDRGGHPARIGAAAPEFTLTESAQDGGRSVDLAQFRGRVVIVNFWAAYCVPCIEELPSLLALERRMPEIAIVAISQDEDADAYHAFLATYHVDLLTLRDPSARIPKLYGTIKIPESYVIDRGGTLRRKFVSAQDWTSPEIVDYLSKL